MNIIILKINIFLKTKIPSMHIIIIIIIIIIIEKP